MTDQKSPEELMKEQEALLMAKYGGMAPKKKKGMLGASKEHKFFDSADWAMNKEAAAKQGPDGAAAGAEGGQAVQEQLRPKLEPTPLPARRISHLDPMDK